MKKCRYCHKYYPESYFGVALTTSKKVYRRHKCKYCYQKTKKKLQEKHKKWIIEYKKKHKCKRCGFSDHRALVFHHINENDKKFNIADRLYYHYGLERIQKELKKCMILCSNCHRILHYEQRNSKKKSK